MEEDTLELGDSSAPMVSSEANDLQQASHAPSAQFISDLGLKAAENNIGSCFCCNMFECTSTSGTD